MLAHRSRSQVARVRVALGAVAMLVALLALAAVPSRVAAAGPCAAPDANGVVVCTFGYTGAPQYWDIPAGVTSLKFDVYGAHGAGDPFFGIPGGNGAWVSGSLDVAPTDVGRTLTLIVGGRGGLGLDREIGGYGGGGNGGGGAGAGGGGGASWVYTTVPATQPGGDPVTLYAFVAGGGGGAGDSFLGSGAAGNGGDSGEAGTAGDASGNGGGGGGGGAGTASAGGTAGAAGTLLNSQQTCGSARGTATASTAGRQFQGGDGGVPDSTTSTRGEVTYLTNGGGGGGGGWYGGGGGGASWSCEDGTGGGGGGGGGSSYSIDENATITEGFIRRSADGLITITYTAPVDTTAPVIGAVVTGTLGSNGWYTSDVGIDFTVTDPESSVTTTCTDRTLSTDGAAIAVNCSASSAGGTASYSRTFKIDRTKPVLAPFVTPDPVDYGQTATANPGATDATSGVATSGCATPPTTTVGLAFVTCSATDNAGNTATGSAQYTVADPTSPSIDYVLDGTEGDNGWYTSDVGIDFTVTDPESSVTTTCTDRTVSAEGSAITVSCSATSAGGLSLFSLTLQIDKTKPVLNPTVTPNPVAAGETAVAEANASDALSGLASASCDLPDTRTSGLRTVQCTATDVAGNAATASAEYEITDPTPPVITPTITGTLGANGWYTSNVSISFSVSDPESDATTTCVDQVLSTDTASTTVSCSATSAGGVTPYSRTFKIDRTKPTLAPVVTPNPVDYGQAASATPGAADATSGLASASCPTPSTTTVGNRSVSCTATDNAGNTATAPASYTVTDPTPPVIGYDLTGTAGDNGWYRSNVGIDFTVSDPESDVTTTCTDRTVSTEGSAVAVTCSASSAGGVTSFSLTLKIDKTAPALNPTVTPNPVFLGGTAVAAPGASDATSGIASASCATASTSTAGVKSVSCTAKDRAGNTASASAGYTVAYRFLGFQKPPTGATLKSGSTIVVQFGLGDASGARLSDAQAQALVAGCLVRVAFTGGSLNPDCVTYNAVSDTFVYELKTAKNVTGDQTITVRVFAGSDVVNTASVTVKLKS